MNADNKRRILNLLKEKSAVLDVGGWAAPFERATHVIDLKPYDTRKGDRTNEFFNKNTWYVLDVCDKEPWPFKNKMFDFVICSHVLEDVRDPLWVCSELQRVGKAGYIETPSRIKESIIGMDSQLPFSKEYAGYWHHRWLVEEQNGELIFTFKSPLLNIKGIRLEIEKITENFCYFWKDWFQYREKRVLNPFDYIEDQRAYLDRYGIKSKVDVDKIKLQIGTKLSKSRTIRKIIKSIFGD